MAILSQIDLSAPRSGDKDQDLLFKIASYLYNEYRSAQSVTTGYVSVTGSPFVQLPNLPAKSVTLFIPYGTSAGLNVIIPATGGPAISVASPVTLPVIANADEISVRRSDLAAGSISYVIIN